MNRTTTWALLGAVLVVVLALLFVIWKYAIGALLWYLIALYVIVAVLFVYIWRISKRKRQVGTV